MDLVESTSRETLALAIGFDRLARYYRVAEVFLAGQILQRARARWLRAITNARHILIVGEGIGRTLEALLPQCEHAQVLVIEISDQMIGVAQRRLRRRYPGYVNRVTWRVADVRDEPSLAGRFDVIITPFVMDCFEDPEGGQVVSYLSRYATQDAWWLHADFHLPARGWQRLRAQAIVWLMYAVFRWAVSLPASRLAPIDPHLKSAGFVRAAQELTCGKLVRSDLWHRSLR